MSKDIDWDTIIRNAAKAFKNQARVQRAKVQGMIDYRPKQLEIDARSGPKSDRRIELETAKLRRYEARQAAAEGGYLLMTQADANDPEYMQEWNPLIGRASADHRVMCEDPILDGSGPGDVELGDETKGVGLP